MPFGYSAIGGLLQDMEATKRRMQAPLAPPPDAFQLPQQGMPQGAPLAPSLAPEPPSSAFANIANANISDARDPTHGHKRGLRGGLLHAIGADKVAPEVAALLSPDQVERVKPGVIGSLWNAINYGVGPQTVMQARAKNIVGLQDEVANRKSAAEMARQRAKIAADYATMPNDPAQRYAALSEMTGRLAAIGHPDAVKYANILNAIKPDVPDPAKPEKPDTINTASGVLKWNPQTREYEPLLVNGKPVMPWAQPLQPSYTIPSGVVGPSGKPMVLNTKTGQLEENPDANVKPSQAAGSRGRAIAEVLPTITSTVAKLRAFTDKDIDKLSATGVNLASVANKTSDTYLGVAAAGVSNSLLTSSQDRQYAQMVRAIGDAVARANEVGILTNQDITRYESQVSFVSGDDKAMKRQKVQNAIAWAEWLQRNKGALTAGAKPGKMPGESDSEYQQRIGVVQRPKWK